MRADLLALGPDALAALANPGLVKRAQKELAAAPPRVEELPDGVIVGTFADGTVTRLPPATALRDAPCSCGAVTVCRHRIAVVLAYGAAAPAPAPPAWDDDALLRALGPVRVEAARAALARSWAGEVALEPVPTVRFDTCSVRFLAGGDLAHARCDCAVDACAHVVLAVWAMRAAPSGGPVALGAAPATAEAAALLPAVALIERVLLDGLAHGGGHVPALRRLAGVLAAERRPWPAAVLEELAAQLDGYARRHARHDPAVAARLCGELVARARAVAGGAAADVVLGAGIPAETLLDTVRLIGLGARVTDDGEACSVEVFLADPDAGVALVLPLRWTLEPGEAPADRRVAAGVTVGRLAAGQVVSRKATRRADRELRLQGGRDTSVLGQTGAWEALPDALRVERLADRAQRTRSLPPRLVGPRVRAQELGVVRVRGVERMRWAPGAQELRADVRDADGAVARLVVPWRAVAPHAVDAVAEALPRATWIAGVLGPGGILEPTALVADRVVVPDLAGPTAAPRLPLDGPTQRSALDAALREAEDALASAAHHGLLARDDGRAREVAARLEAVGLAGVAASVGAWGAAARAGRADPSRASEAAAAWASAAIRVALALA